MNHIWWWDCLLLYLLVWWYEGYKMVKDESQLPNHEIMTMFLGKSTYIYIQIGWDCAAESKHSSRVLLVTSSTSTSRTWLPTLQWIIWQHISHWLRNILHTLRQYLSSRTLSHNCCSDWTFSFCNKEQNCIATHTSSQNQFLNEKQYMLIAWWCSVSFQIVALKEVQTRKTNFH